MGVIHDMNSAMASKPAKKCAYCDIAAPLTKEHIWPASIINRVNDRASYLSKIGKLLWTDLVIKDVCEKCNNGPLSHLDEYGATLYDAHFADYAKDATAVEFRYDFQKLAKWLIKLSYNSARAAGSDFQRLSHYKAALIQPTVPLPDDFSIAVDLVLPSPIDGVQNGVFPSSNRICRIAFTHGVADWCTVRLVAINSFYFWILIQHKPNHLVNPDHARAVLSKIRGAYLPPSSDVVRITPSGLTTLEMHKDWAPALKQAGFPVRK